MEKKLTSPSKYLLYKTLTHPSRRGSVSYIWRQDVAQDIEFAQFIHPVLLKGQKDISASTIVIFYRQPTL
jgi:hypothetical protein